MSASSESFGGERNQRALVLALSGIIALVFVGLIYFLFFRGGGAEEPAPARTGAAPEAGAAVPELDLKGSPKGDGKAGPGPKETTKVFASKDPFEPLVSLGTADTTGDAATTGDATTDDSAASPGTDVTEEPLPGETGGIDDGGAATGASGGGGPGGLRVELVDVRSSPGGRSATVEVDGTRYEVAPKEIFATNFKVVSLYGKCAGLLFGDEQFTLCEGDEILK